MPPWSRSEPATSCPFQLPASLFCPCQTRYAALPLSPFGSVVRVTPEPFLLRPVGVLRKRSTRGRGAKRKKKSVFYQYLMFDTRPEADRAEQYLESHIRCTTLYTTCDQGPLLVVCSTDEPLEVDTILALIWQVQPDCQLMNQRAERRAERDALNALLADIAVDL